MPFAQRTSEIIYDLLETCGLEFRLCQCAAVLYERAVVRVTPDEESAQTDGGLDAMLKLLGLSLYVKAFPETEDLEWFLKLRPVYFGIILKVISEVAFDGDDDDASEHNLARQALSLAASVATTLDSDLAALDHSVCCSIAADAREVARQSVVDAWATVLQRACEVECCSKPIARTENQWRQYRQTVLMQHKGKRISDLRSIINTEFPTADITSAHKDAMVRFIVDAKVKLAKDQEESKLKEAADAFATDVAEALKVLGPQSGAKEAESDPLRAAGWKFFQSGMTEAAAGLAEEARSKVMTTCSALTSAINQIPDVGVDRLVIKRTPGTMKPLDKIGAVYAVQASDAVDLKLHFRGTVTPACNVEAFSNVVAVFDDIATVDKFKLCLVITKDATCASKWDSHKVCPAVLVRQQKEKVETVETGTTSAKKGSKGKSKPQALAKSTTPTVHMTLETSVQTVCEISVKLFSLVATVPALASPLDEDNASEETAPADRILSLTAPTLKRTAEAQGGAAAKKLRTQELLAAK